MMASADAKFRAAFERLAMADDAWEEMIRILADIREQNRQVGGDDEWFAMNIAAQVAMMPLPVRSSGGSK